MPKQRTIEKSKAVDRGAPRRTVRVEDDLWSRAQAAAAERGEDLSKVIRAALKAYIDGRLGQVIALADEAASGGAAADEAP